MSIETVAKKSKVLAQAIRQLREALEETQEGMARRLGCTLSGYIQWEKGRRVPGGVWVLKMMALAPDSWSRRLFQEQVLAGSPQPASPAPRTRPVARSASTTPDQRRRAKSVALEAIEILFELGEAGFRPADQKLKTLADSLNRIAGDFSRASGLKT
ncbi:MAG: helix-turn-helix transcriptional regulator [Acidobacteria bacterium]|nr:helix-turn-helix transcriptional regulator [Acidobacteriota bacterium]